MVVVTVIGILALLAIPQVRTAQRQAEAAATANDLRVFAEALEFYSTTKGAYPESMRYTDMPDDLANYIPQVWKNGVHSWFYENSRGYVYLYLYNLGFTTEQAIRLDNMLDDGNIATGSIRIAFNGAGLTYMFKYPELMRVSSRDRR
jgi:type II secretory pathway pseudopilin PulG